MELHAMTTKTTVVPFPIQHNPQESSRMNHTRTDQADPGLDELEIPGRVIEVEPELAEAMGAFEEDALTEAEALDSTLDNDLTDDDEEAGSAG